MISIQFFKPSTLWGRIICAVTGRPYAHVGIGHLLLGNPFLTHSYERYGVCCWPVGLHIHAQAKIELPWVEEEWAVEWLSKAWGGTYGWSDFFLFPFKKTRLNDGDHPGVICSEFVIIFLQTVIQRRKLSFLWTPAERELMEIRDPSSISPGALFELVRDLTDVA